MWAGVRCVGWGATVWAGGHRVGWGEVTVCGAYPKKWGAFWPGVLASWEKLFGLGHGALRG